jgi:hypothetical protein
MTKDQNSKGVRHQEGPFLPSMRTIKRELKNNKNIKPLVGIEDQNLGGVKHQEDHFISGMRIFSCSLLYLQKLWTQRNSLQNQCKKQLCEK